MLKPGFSFYFTECKKDGHGLISRAPAAATVKGKFPNYEVVV